MSEVKRQFSIRLNEDLIEVIDRMAADQNRNRSTQIEYLLKNVTGVITSLPPKQPGLHLETGNAGA